jgi:hypothetical protein
MASVIPYAAAFILEAWSFIHGAEPAPKNKDAAAAADLFWNVSMGFNSIGLIQQCAYINLREIRRNL